MLSTNFLLRVIGQNRAWQP